MMTATLMAVALEPGFTDVDLAKYAITQGGLVLVVLVILWSYRRDFARLLDEDKQKYDVLVTIVGDARTAMTSAAAASESQKEATERLTEAIDRLERRR